MIKIADKTVKQPFVFVNGEWRSVKKESVSVNGSWRTVWEKGYAVTIKYYDGKTYTTQTLTTDSNGVIKLPTPAANWNGGVFYGWGTTSSTTTRSYTGGQTVTLTAAKTLYAIYTYTVSLYKYGTLYNTLTARSQGLTASFTLPAATVDSGDYQFYGWTVTNGSTSISYSAGAADLYTRSLYAVYSYYRYNGQTNTVVTKTTEKSAGTKTVEIDGVTPGTSWSAEITECTPNQITFPINGGGSGQSASGTGYDVQYRPKGSVENLSGTANTDTITVKSYTPSSGSFVKGSVTTTANAGGVVTGTSDTRENVTCYSYISAKVTYYKYSSKTLAYRSSK